MSEQIPTIKIKGEDGNALVINLHEYDKDKHELFEPAEDFDRKVAEDYLTKRGVKFNPRLGDKKLKALVEETQANETDIEETQANETDEVE